MDERLRQLESASIYVIREAYRHFPKLATLWSVGKDSTTLLWLCRKAFFGRIPFPVLHLDTGYKLPQMYRFRDERAREWGLDLRVVRNEAAIAAGMSPQKEKLACCTALKTEALKIAIARFGLQALLLGIRRDEHGIRAKERYFSPRDESFRWDYQNQPAELWDQYKSQAEEGSHIRVHPLLHWTELDVWSYIKAQDIPVTELYFAKDGQRYRSVGCMTCCSPVPSSARNVHEILEELRTTRTAERSGRAQDKESAYTMQKLRAMGYM